ncbi:hypothetical protein ES703_116638 [subsurface metagenome]
MSHLKKQCPVAKSVTALDAFAAADAQQFVNRVLVIGVLHKSAFYRSCGTKLIFGALGDIKRLRPKKAETDFAVSAHCVSVDTLNCRLLQYAVRCTITAGNTNFRVDLPDHILLSALGAQDSSGSAKPS